MRLSIKSAHRRFGFDVTEGNLIMKLRYTFGISFAAFVGGMYVNENLQTNTHEVPRYMLKAMRLAIVVSFHLVRELYRNVFISLKKNLLSQTIGCVSNLTLIMKMVVI